LFFFFSIPFLLKIISIFLHPHTQNIAIAKLAPKTATNETTIFIADLPPLCGTGTVPGTIWNEQYLLAAALAVKLTYNVGDYAVVFDPFYQFT